MESVCVLLVEDELDMAALMVKALSDCGFEVVHAASVESAFDAIASKFIQAAVLDINVGDELVYPVATLLQAIGVPFVFASGANFDTEAVELKPHALIAKPYFLSSVVDALRSALKQDLDPSV
jgi:DNA-binding response OmpR family regulator